MEPSMHISADDNQVLQAAQISIMKKQSNQEAAQALSLLQSTVQQCESIQNSNQNVSSQAPRELPMNATFEIEA